MEPGKGYWAENAKRLIAETEGLVVNSAWKFLGSLEKWFHDYTVTLPKLIRKAVVEKMNHLPRKRLGKRRSVCFAIGLFTILLSACNPPAEIVRHEDLNINRPGASAIVIVFSRSGHTAQAGQALAQELGADYRRIVGPPGAGDSFFSTPGADAEVEIAPPAIDLAPYKLIILGTPIWYWKPTAIINTFIKHSDFQGRPVVLFYTNQGGVSSGALDRWKRLVERSHGLVRDLIGINRKKLEAGETIQAQAVRITRERRSTWLTP